MLPALISLVTSRHTVASIPPMPKSAMSVAKCMSPCLHYPCTSWHTTWVIDAMFAERPSPDPGYCRATWGHTLVTNPILVPFAKSRLPIAPIYGHTCKLIPRQRISSALDATRHLHSSPTWTSTTSRHVCVALLPAVSSPLLLLQLLPVAALILLPPWQQSRAPLCNIRWRIFHTHCYYVLHDLCHLKPLLMLLLLHYLFSCLWWNLRCNAIHNDAKKTHIWGVSFLYRL